MLGPALTLPRHLELARRAAGHDGPVVTAPKNWLLAHGVEPWMGPRSLPLWLPDPAWRGFNARDGSRARRAGLRTRPLEDTLADVLAEELRQPARARKAGLSDEDELALLEQLTA